MPGTSHALAGRRLVVLCPFPILNSLYPQTPTPITLGAKGDPKPCPRLHIAAAPVPLDAFGNTATMEAGKNILPTNPKALKS